MLGGIQTPHHSDWGGLQLQALKIISFHVPHVLLLFSYLNFSKQHNVVDCMSDMYNKLSGTIPLNIAQMRITIGSKHPGSNVTCVCWKVNNRL